MNKKSQLIILSILFLTSLLIFIHYLGVSNLYNLKNDKNLMLNEIKNEICLLADGLYNDSIEINLNKFKAEISSFCLESSNECNLEILRKTPFPTSSQIIVINDFILTLNYSNNNFNSFSQVIC